MPPIFCPCCQSPMQPLRFARKLHGEIELDLCFSCQCIWFDEFESSQLAPAGVLALFRAIHEHQGDLRQPWPDSLNCPRCSDRMIHGIDLCKNGRFSYHRCPLQHGRLSAFSSFLMEKGFVRPLNGAERAALADKVGIVRCSGCGAAVDIQREMVCGHCRSPISILDPEAVEKALSAYSQAAYRAEHLDPNALADALLANERVKSQARLRERIEGKSPGLDDLAEAGDLLLTGVGFVVEFFSES